MKSDLNLLQIDDAVDVTSRHALWRRIVSTLNNVIEVTNPDVDVTANNVEIMTLR